MRISLDKAAELLNAGKVIGVPTETVYGLAASLNHPQAIADIFSLKGRPSNNPLIVHLSGPEQLKKYAQTLPPAALQLAQAFWPGPLTLVVPVVLETVPALARAGLPTAAFRVPAHPVAQELLKRTGPLLMPSANLSGRPSATCVEHVEEDFGMDFPVLDGGVCQQGLESTILAWQDHAWVVVRQGALTPEVFGKVLEYVPKIINIDSRGVATPLCPGQMYRHYAPKAQLNLVSQVPEGAQGVVLGFDDRLYPTGLRLFSLGNSHDPASAAHRLYAVLRELDQQGIPEAWVDMDFPDNGLWLTLKERLSKAAKAKQDEFA